MTRSAVPRLIVDDPDEAIEFYRRGLGARLVERYVLDEVVVHAALAVGDASFTLAAEVRDWGLLSPRSVGGASSLVTLDVADAPEVAAAMVAAGAEIVVPVIDRPYGRCEGRVRDPFGHLWIPSHHLDAPAVPMVRRIVPDLTAGDLSRRRCATNRSRDRVTPRSSPGTALESSARRSPSGGQLPPG